MTLRAPTLGVSLPNRAVMFGVAPQTLIDVAIGAEKAGAIDSVWVGDNFLSQPRLESLMLLAAIAARTRRVRLGTLCLATFAMRQPLQLAIQWASLDLLSGGRTILGVCNGHSGKEGEPFARELRAMAIRSQDRAPRLEEGIEVLRKAWGPGPVDHHGRFYSFDGLDCLPKPVQNRVPIVIAGNPPPAGSAEDPGAEERQLRRVARLADGWQSGGSPDVFRQRWDRIREYADEYGRKDEVVHSIVHLRVNINDDARQAHRDATDFTARYYSDTLSPEVLAASDRSLVCGPPELIIERIARFVEAGCTTPVLGFMALDQERQLERCVASVLPAFKNVTVPT